MEYQKHTKPFVYLLFCLKKEQQKRGRDENNQRHSKINPRQLKRIVGLHSLLTTPPPLVAFFGRPRPLAAATLGDFATGSSSDPVSSSAERLSPFGDLAGRPRPLAFDSSTVGDAESSAESPS